MVVSANLGGDMLAYGLARRMTARAAWDRRTDVHPTLARLERHLKSKPILTVVGSRFVPFVSGGVNSLSGMCRLTPLKFATADLVGTTLYATAYLLLGQAFGRAWGDAVRVASLGGAILFVITASGVIGWLVLRRGKSAGDESPSGSEGV